MKLALVTAAGLALALAACSGEGNEQRAPDQTMEPVNAAQDAASVAVGAGAAALASRNTSDFVAAAAMSDMFEIESSRMAVGRSQNAGVKAYAQRMIDEHTRSSAELKAAAQGVEDAVIPTELDERRKGMLDNLRGASPVDFDDRYLDQQSAAHRETLTFMEGYANGGDNPALKAFAAKATPMIRMHLDEAVRLDRVANADDPAGANSEGANGSGQMPAGESGQTQQ
jgi:putative membrane protein